MTIQLSDTRPMRGEVQTTHHLTPKFFFKNLETTPAGDLKPCAKNGFSGVELSALLRRFSGDSTPKSNAPVLFDSVDFTERS